MATKIQWCDETINPIQDTRKGESGRGYHCTKVSRGCAHCYAEGINNRFGNGFPFDNTPVKFELIESELAKPLKWKKPRRIFVQSMGDLFHEDVSFPFITKVMVTISHSKQHTFLLLTKRPKRMSEVFEDVGAPKNCWLGVSVEDQRSADERIPILLQIPAAVHFVSYEPALGEVVFSPYTYYLDWLVMGAESGQNRRTMKYEWAFDTLEQCQDAGTHFFYKQGIDDNGKWCKMPKLNGKVWGQMPEIKKG